MAPATAQSELPASAAEGVSGSASPKAAGEPMADSAAQQQAAGSSGAAGSGSAAARRGEQQAPPAPRRNLQLASLLLERGRHADALEALQPLLAQAPGDATLLCLQGRCLAASGRRPQVRAAGWLAGKGKGLVLLLLFALPRARRLYRGPSRPAPTSPLPQALASFAAALAASPRCLPALLGCAEVYKESRLLTEALASLEQALTLLQPSTLAAEQEGGSDADAAAAGGEAAEEPAGEEPEAAAAAAAAVPGLQCSAEHVRRALALVLTDLGMCAARLLLPCSVLCAACTSAQAVPVEECLAQAGTAVCGSAQRRRRSLLNKSNPPHLRAPTTPQARRRSWRGGRGGSGGTSERWRPAPPTPPPTTT